MQPRFLVRQAREVAERLPAAMDQAAVQAIAPALTPSAPSFAEGLERFIATTAKKLAARLTSAR